MLGIFLLEAVAASSSGMQFLVTILLGALAGARALQLFYWGITAREGAAPGRLIAAGALLLLGASALVVLGDRVLRSEMDRKMGGRLSKPAAGQALAGRGEGAGR